MVGVVGAGVRDVVEHLLAVQAKALRDCEEADRAEGSLSVNVETLALAAAHAHRQLAGNGKRMAELRLARAELAEHLRDRAGFDPAWEAVSG